MKLVSVQSEDNSPKVSAKCGGKLWEDTSVRQSKTVGSEDNDGELADTFRIVSSPVNAQTV